MTEEHLEGCLHRLDETRKLLDSIQTDLRGAQEFRDAVFDLLEGTSFGAQVDSTYDGLYGRLRAALVATQVSPPTPQRELVGEVIRGVRDRLTASGQSEDYNRGVCDACNDSLELLYTGKLTSRVSPPTPEAEK